MSAQDLTKNSFALTLTIQDETITGKAQNSLSVSFVTECVTVRELIRERVYQEVRAYNTTTEESFHGLVQPVEAEVVLNGYSARPKRSKRCIDWEAQYEKAVDAFVKNGFFILVNDKQVEDLEDTILLTPTTKVAFIKLIPLVGG